MKITIRTILKEKICSLLFIFFIKNLFKISLVNIAPVLMKIILEECNDAIEHTNNSPKNNGEYSPTTLIKCGISPAGLSDEILFGKILDILFPV